MTQLTTIKLGLGAVALVFLGVGIRNDDALVRWIGVGLLVLAFMLRTLNRRERP